MAEISGKAWVEDKVKGVKAEVWRLMRMTRLVQPGAKGKGNGMASSEGADRGEGLRRLEDRMDKLMELLAGGLGRWREDGRRWRRIRRRLRGMWTRTRW